MKIEGLSIDGFGLFHDVDIQELPPGLTLFVGDNEAGKSTALSFVLTVLFGFPDGRSREKDYPPLNGGKAGGRLQLVSQADGALSVERRDGTRGGPVTAMYEDGRRDGAAAINRLLGGTTRRVYRNLYAFSLTELQEIETLTDEEVKDMIYGASLGIGVRSLSEARKQLDKRLGELFKPKASKPLMNKLLKQLEEVREEIRDAKKGFAEHEQYSSEIERQEDKITDVKERLRIAREKQSQLKSFIQLWGDWITYQDTMQQLSDLSPVVKHFPEEGVARLNLFNDRIVAEEHELFEETAEFDEKKRDHSAIQLNKLLLQQAGGLRALMQSLGTFEQSSRDLPRAEDRQQTLQRQIDDILSELGTGWTEIKVAQIDRSAHTQSAIDNHNQDLQAAQEKRRACEQRMNAAERELEEAGDEFSEAQKVMNTKDAANLEVDRETLNKLRNGFEQFRNICHDLPTVETQLADCGTNLQHTLREIDKDWTTETLQMFDCSVTAKQQVSQFEKDTVEHEKKHADNTAEKNRIERELSDLRRRFGGLKKELKNVVDGGATQADQEDRITRIRSLQSLVNRRELAKKDLEALERQVVFQTAADPPFDIAKTASSLKLLGVGILFAALVATVALWLLQLQNEAVVAGVLLGFVSVGIWLLSRKLGAARPTEDDARDGEDSLEAELEQCRKTLHEIVQEIQVECDHLKVIADVDGILAERLRDEADKQLRAVEKRDRVKDQIDACEAEYVHLKSDLKNNTNLLANEKAAGNSRQKKWREYLQELSLPPQTDPRSVSLVFEKAETANREVRSQKQLQDRLSDMIGTFKDYMTIMPTVPSLGPLIDKSKPEILDGMNSFFALASQQEKDQLEHQRLHTGLEESKKRVQRLQENFQDLESEVQQVVEQELQAKAAWRLWLRDNGLQEDWSPDFTKTSIDRAGRLSELVADREESSTLITRLQQEQQQFEERLALVFSELEQPEPEPSQVGAVIRNLDIELEGMREKKALEEQLARDVPNLERRCNERKKQLQDLKEELKELFTQGRAEDEDAFRRRAEAYQQLHDLNSGLATLRSAIKKVAGVADFEALETILEEQSLDNLRAESQQLEIEIDHDHEQIEQLLDERGQYQERIRELSVVDTIARKRAEEEQLLQKLREHADDWSRYAVAQYLLDTAKDRFEQAHQPEVIQQAGNFFSTITGGRYKRLFTSVNDTEIEVVDCQQQHKTVEELSRGTAEQLYLAIRLGYISTHNVGGETLPILMDDVLVNFDPTRSANSAKAIIDMSKTHQVLFFTCHPNTVDMFCSIDPHIPVYRLADNTIRREQ